VRRIASNPKKSRDAFLGLGGVALGLALLFGRQVLAEIDGPVVGFQRIVVGAGSQSIKPTVQPFIPDTSIGETKAQALTDFLGEEFVSSTNADSSDWVGCANSQYNTNSVTMIWRDQEGQWHDLLGNALDPDCSGTSAFWLDLVFGSELSTSIQTRELVLSGQVAW
jgi:hypothetical protein